MGSFAILPPFSKIQLGENISLPFSQNCTSNSKDGWKKTFIPSFSGLKGSNGKKLRYKKREGMSHLSLEKDWCSVIKAGSPEGVETVTEPETEQRDNTDVVDKLINGVSFGQLCDDFECVSSPAVERTARQLARDIMNVKENKRLLSCYGMTVKYKDPLRSFTGREKFKRPSWLLTAIEKPKVAVLEMSMKSTSDLTIRWQLQGNFQLPGMSSLAGPLSLTVLSSFSLNQISGQVVEQTDGWDLSGSSPLASTYFWSSRAAWSMAEAGRDAKEFLSVLQNKMSKGMDDRSDIYADPGDPRKFFQQSNPNSEIYQIGFVVALIYLLVQFLRLTL